MKIGTDGENLLGNRETVVRRAPTAPITLTLTLTLSLTLTPILTLTLTLT